MTQPKHPIIGVRVRLPDGRFFDAAPGEVVELGRPDVKLSVHPREFDILHAGNSRNYGLFPWPQASPFQMLSVWVRTRDPFFPLGVPLNKAADLWTGFEGEALWELVGPSSRRIDDPDYPETLTYPDGVSWLAGGDRYVCRVATGLEDHALPQAELVDQVLGLVGFDRELVEVDAPRLSQVLGLYTGTPQSANPNWHTGGSRDLLARMIPAVYHASLGGSRQIDGWYHAGDVQWAAGFCNLHYQHALWAIIKGVTTGDLFAYNLGLWMLRMKAGLGHVWSTDPACWHRWMQHYEKGNERRGSYYWPSTYKQWVVDFVVADLLLEDQDDRYIHEAVEAAYELWRSRTPSGAAALFNGRYGERILAFELRNLRALWLHAGVRGRADDQAHFEAMAEALLAVGFGYAEYQLPGTSEWFAWFANVETWPNIELSPWMQTGALAAAHWWMKERGLFSEHLADGGLFQAMVQRVLDVGNPIGADDWHLPYRASTSFQPTQGGSPTHVSTLHPVIDVAEDLGITHARTSAGDVDLAEVRRRVTITGLNKAGQINANLGTYAPGVLPSSARLDFFGGVDGGMGAATSKLLSSILGAALWRERATLESGGAPG